MKRAATTIAPLQRWFHAAIADRDGVAAARGIDLRLLPSPQLGARERLGIYANAVYLRFLGVLRGDFRGVVAAVGDEPFAALARAYVARHPPSSFTLNDLGARFPAWLAREAPRGAWRAIAAPRPFVAEVALLERTVDELFHARHAAAAPTAALASLRPAQWARARFERIPASRLLALRWPVDPWLQSLYDGKPQPLPARGASWLLVHRRDGRVWRTRLTALQHRLLTALARGARLSDALERVARDAEERALLLANVGRWFSEWSGDGLFAAIRAR